MRALVLMAILLLSGCASVDAGADERDPRQPIYDGSEPVDAAPGRPTPDIPYDGISCDNLTIPERWYGHSSGELWCVRDGGFDGHSGSIMAPGVPLRDSYAGLNGSAGHPAGTPVDAHVSVLCWSGPCFFQVEVAIMADGIRVATLQSEELVVHVIVVSSATWIDLEGELSASIPPGSTLSIDVSAEGVGPLALLGTSGSSAPWFGIGAA